MADYGLLGGLGAFGQNFATALRGQQDYNMRLKQLADQQANQHREQAMKEQQAGLIHNDAPDENGNEFSYTPEMQQQKQLQSMENQRQLGLYDPEKSAPLVKSYKGALESLHPGAGGFIPEGSTAKDIIDEKGLLGHVIPAVGQIARTENINDRYAAGRELRIRALDNQDKRIGMIADNQAAKAADLFDKDPIIKDLNVQQNNIRRGSHTLASVQTVTPQIFDEVQTDIANAISKGGSHAVSSEQKKMYEFAAKDWASLKQRIYNKPQDIGSPEMKASLINIIDRLDAAYSQNISDRASQLKTGRKFSNPAAQEALEAKGQQYIKQPGLLQQATAAPGGNSKVINGKNYIKVNGGWQLQE